MRWLFFSPLVFLVYGGICFYVGKNSFNFIFYYFPAVRAPVFWIIFTLLCCSFIIVNLFRNNLEYFRNFAFYWLVFLLYMFKLLAVRDLARLALFLAGKKIQNINVHATGAAVLLCIVLIIYGIFHARSIKNVNYSLTLRGTGSGIRAVLISDLHISPAIGSAWVNKITSAVNSRQPDIVFIAGDIFDGYLDGIKDLNEIILHLKKLRAPLGVYACLGNHDVDRMSFNKGSTYQIEEILKKADIVLLQDKVLQVRENLYIAGRRDARPIGMSAVRKTPDELLSGLKGAVIVMDHQPVQFPALEQAGAALVLSGHTHRGQIFPGSILTRMIFKGAGGTDYGFWQGKTMQAVVTSGAGVWGPALRIGTNSEIAVIDISFY